MEVIMWAAEIPAFIPLFLGSVIALFTRGYVRGILLLGIIILSGIHLWMIPDNIQVTINFLGYELMPYRVDKLSLMFGYIFHIAALIGVIYSLRNLATGDEITDATEL